MASHSNTLAWRIPWTEELGGLLSMGSQRIRHHLATVQKQHVFFGEMSVQLLGPFFDWVIYFSGIELQELLIYF